MCVFLLIIIIIIKSKNNLTLQKEIEIDIINNKNSKFYKITNSMMQRY